MVLGPQAAAGQVVQWLGQLLSAVGMLFMALMGAAVREFLVQEDRGRVVWSAWLFF